MDVELDSEWTQSGRRVGLRVDAEWTWSWTQSWTQSGRRVVVELHRQSEEELDRGLGLDKKTCTK